MILIIGNFIIFDSEEENDDEEKIGIVNNIEKRDTGYIFDFCDENDMTIKCFCKSKPDESSLYTINGTYSDDGQIFFVDELREY